MFSEIHYIINYLFEAWDYDETVVKIDYQNMGLEIMASLPTSSSTLA